MNKYVVNGYVVVVSGLVVAASVVWSVLEGSAVGGSQMPFVVLLLANVVFCAAVAKMKRRSYWFGLFGLVGMFGWWVVAALRSHVPTMEQRMSEIKKEIDSEMGK